ncbi:hypothetical protein [Streptomyces sp. NPDC001315]|uniref:hypothetical protein n=1 Tax=Streptomyces sp. NPDC001315 TaxID=3364562 RepID=UPI0036C11625
MLLLPRPLTAPRTATTGLNARTCTWNAKETKPIAIDQAMYTIVSGANTNITATPNWIGTKVPGVRPRW